MSKKPVKGTRQSTINKRRKGLMAVVLPWGKRFGVISGIAALALWGGAWVYMIDGHNKALSWVQEKTAGTMADAGFAVENILVEGREQTDPEALLVLIDVEKGDPLLAINPREIKARIEQMEWVASARVERRFPDTLYIRLQERVPIAFWQREKDTVLIDEAGEIINAGQKARFKNLMIVSGRAAPEHAKSLIDMMTDYPALSERVQAAMWMGDRRWDFLLKTGVAIKCPEGDLAAALDLLAEAQQQHGLLDKDIQSIDLREQGRIIIRTKPGEAQEYFKKQDAGLKAGDDI
jgi:cell division protein FtsQ